MRRAISYIRFSSELQRKSGSYSRQLQKTKKYCEENNLELIHAVEDLAVSASTGKNLEEKSGLGNFIRQVELKKIETPVVLVLEQLDRATRLEPLEGVELIKKLINLGVSIASVQENKIYDQESLSNAFSLITLIMTLNAAHEYTKNMGERSHQGWQIKKKNMSPEKILTTAVPSWIEITGEGDKKKMSVKKERAKIVNEIFDLYLKGTGTGTIAKKLNERGEDTPSVWQGNKFLQKTNLERRSGSLWNDGTVRKFLKNHAVYGTHLPFVKRKGKKIQSGEPIENYYPPIMKREKFYKVQIELEKRSRKKGPNTNRSNLFTGQIFCASCGYPMIYNSGNKKLDEDGRQKFQYLKCKNAEKGGDCKNSPLKPFKYQPFEDAVLTIQLNQIINALYDTAESDTLVKLKTELDEKMSRLKIHEESMEEYQNDGQKYPTYLGKKYTELENEIKLLREKIEMTPNQEANPWALADALEDIRSGKKQPLENNNQNRALVSGLATEWFERIEIDPEKKLCMIKYKYSIELNGKNWKPKIYFHFNYQDEDYYNGGFCQTSIAEWENEPTEEDFSIYEYEHNYIFKQAVMPLPPSRPVAFPD